MNGQDHEGEAGIWRELLLEMETAGRFNRSASRNAHETELGEMKLNSMEMGSRATSGVPCRNGACSTSRQPGGKPRVEHAIESPWHYLKTIFLVSMLVAFVVWLLVYVLLTQYELL